jgi:hypothetical protein
VPVTVKGASGRPYPEDDIPRIVRDLPDNAAKLFGAH